MFDSPLSTGWLSKMWSVVSDTLHKWIKYSEVLAQRTIGKHFGGHYQIGFVNSRDLCSVDIENIRIGQRLFGIGDLFELILGLTFQNNTYIQIFQIGNIRTAIDCNCLPWTNLAKKWDGGCCYKKKGFLHRSEMLAGEIAKIDSQILERINYLS